MARLGDSTAAARRPAVVARPGALRPASPTTAPAERARHLRVVRPVARRRRAGLAVVVLCLVFFSAAIGVVAFQAQLAENQLVLDQLDRDYRAELRAYDEYRAQLAQLQSPSYVLPMADRLGLHRVAPVYLSPSAATAAAVLAAVGPQPEDAGGGLVRPDWSNVKPIVGSAP